MVGTLAAVSLLWSDRKERRQWKVTYSQVNDGTLAAALAAGKSELAREGMARVCTSEE